MYIEIPSAGLAIEGDGTRFWTNRRRFAYGGVGDLKFGRRGVTEQYDVAAWRHFNVGEHLENIGELDDAGYHFGVAGENAVKHSLRSSGVEAAWIANGITANKTPLAALISTPMRKHFPSLPAFVQSTQAEIALHGQGRLAAAISQVVLHPTFSNRFHGWAIDIRYANTTCTPVSIANCQAWHNDASDLILALLI